MATSSRHAQVPSADPPVDSPALHGWDRVEARGGWTGLLVGNGASIAFWEDFAYDSLFELARSPDVDHPLSTDDLALFDAFRTSNFEQVLASLKTARSVLQALSCKTDFLKERYESVQRSLFEAVHSAHVPWGVGSRFEEKLRGMRRTLREYEWVFSLNYDLILYWAVTSEDKGRGIVDFFWHSDLSFDPSDTDLPAWVPPDSTRLVWLHGCIHLRRHVDGTVFKARSSDATRRLLDQFKTSYTGDVIPLLISEGTAEDKYRAIVRSTYLEFGFRSLAEQNGGLVIFGSSLRPEDAHLVRAIKARPDRRLAISVRPHSDASSIIERKAQIRALFPQHELVFFDSETHPLGSTGIRVRSRFRLPWR